MLLFVIRLTTLPNTFAAFSNPESTQTSSLPAATTVITYTNPLFALDQASLSALSDLQSLRYVSIKHIDYT
jgi:hypothetical protein